MLLLLPGQGPDRDPVYLVPDPDYLVLGPVGQDLADRDPVGQDLACRGPVDRDLACRGPVDRDLACRG
ncbi:hypothetical protein, partial [Hominiventricola filiformis]|uniref:hypothetical protein n=1 Tax=Hominiventricola filiformis TaxID=2885352 RepID=UPI0032C1B959